MGDLITEILKKVEIYSNGDNHYSINKKREKELRSILENMIDEYVLFAAQGVWT